MIEWLNQFSSHQSRDSGIGHADNQVRLQRSISQFCDCGIFVVIDALLYRDAKCFFEIGNHFWVGVISPVQNFNSSTFIDETICNWFSNEWESDW